MKREKMIKAMAALCAVGTLLSGMTGMEVQADQAPKNAEIRKVLNKGLKDYAPNTEFEFTVEPGKAVDGSASSQKVYAGLPGGVTVAGTIVSKPNEKDLTVTSLEVGTTNLVMHPEVFTRPGIYRYIVSEVAGSYDGVTYTTEKKWFDVYVDNRHVIYSYTFTDPLAPTKKDDGVFENTYELKDLTVNKSVQGLQGDKNQLFDFTIQIDGAAGEKYYGVLNNGTTVTFDTGMAKTIQLKDSENIVIYGLSPSDTFDVREQDYTTDGYKTTVDGSAGREKSGSIEVDQSVDFVNTRDSATPTGVFTERMPYVLMIAAGAAVLAVFFRSRKHSEV